MMMRFLLFPISWWLFIFLIQLPAILLGWILVPLAAACKAYESYVGFDGAGKQRLQYRFTWPFMWLWDNKIDGIADNTYSKHENMFLRIVSWSANRNPASNLRFVKYLSFKINPDKVRFIGSRSSLQDGIMYPPVGSVFKDMTISYRENTGEHWFLCWHGCYSCFYWQGKKKKLWIGWKIIPKDIYGLEKTSYRYESTGFALQFKDIK